MAAPGHRRPDGPREGIDSVLARAVAAHRAGDLDAASRIYRRILRTRPGHCDALHLSGLVAFQQGRLTRAVQLIEQAIRRDGFNAEYHANLGRVLQAAGRAAEAAGSFRRALTLDPRSAVLYSDLAAALIACDTVDEAPDLCRRALALDPGLAAAQVNLGIALMRLGDAEAAEGALAAALRLVPDDPFTLFQMGRALQARDRPERAAEVYRRALALAPGMAEAHSNLGNILKDAGDFDGAVREYEAALAIDPGLATAHGNLGVVRQEQGEFEAALDCFDRALDLAPDDAECHRNRAMVLLLTGRLREGWEDYEWRWRTAHFAPVRRDFPMPPWTGEDLSRRRILVHAEQGFGDTLQFCRYLPLLTDRGAEVVFECPNALAGMVASVSADIQVVTAGNRLPDADFHVPLMSLPYRFETELATIPARTPYLFADPDAVDRWRDRLGDGGGLRVGVAWRGSARFKRDRIRSPGLAVLEPLFGIAGVRFFSLQKDGGADDLADAGLKGTVRDLTGDWNDFSDSAAAVAGLDLVITPDTAAAHLAGALGRPVWVLLPHVAEWRWLSDRADSPWYPTARLFRQDQPGEWPGVVARVAEELGKML